MTEKRIELKEYQCYYEGIYFEPTNDIYLKAILTNGAVDSVQICEAYEKVLMNIRHTNGQNKYIYLNVYDENFDFKFRVNSHDKRNGICSFSEVEFGSD